MATAKKAAKKSGGKSTTRLPGVGQEKILNPNKATKLTRKSGGKGKS